jgi:hypothetical protein
MADGPEKRKDLWDKLSSITPLILGIAVTGVGAFFTQIYNYRQLQLNQITALEKLRPLLSSDKDEDREFGYASFAALGYEEMAVRIIQIKKDQSGRTMLLELQKTSGDPQVQANATGALKSLDEARSLVNKLEYGDTRGLDSWMEKGAQVADELGLKTKLGRALMSADVIGNGPGRVKKLAGLTSTQLGGNPASGVDEKAWVAKYLDVAVAQSRVGVSRTMVERRVREFRSLIDKGDWALSTYTPTPPASAPQEQE